jgi:hypothetical protein
MTGNGIASVAGFYPACDACFPVCFGLEIFYQRLLPSSHSLQSNCCGTNPSLSSLCLL